MAPRYEPQAGLGRALRALRRERGLTQEQVAQAAGMHPTWVSHLESGRNNPAWGSVRRLCRALDVKLAELAELAERFEASEQR